MPAIGALAGMEIAGAGDGVGWDRRRRSRSNRRNRIPIEINSQAAFNNYINSLSFNLSLPISEEVDLESGELEVKVHSSFENNGKQCRICHLKFEGSHDDNDDDDDDDDDDYDVMELGCDCKGDLASAHKKCALTWFLIKGDLNCEICGSRVQNVGALVQNVDQFEAIEEVSNEDDEADNQHPELVSFMAETILEPGNGRRSFMHGHRCVNVVAGCMAFAFLISWLFHFNILQ